MIYQDGIQVRTPCLYHFIPHVNAQVLEELPDVTALSKFFLSPESNSVPDSFVLSIGRALGHWMASFHNRSSIPEVLREVGPNERGREAMYTLLAGGVANAINRCPHLFEGRAEEFRKYVQDELDGEIEEASKAVVHGDFAIRK